MSKAGRAGLESPGSVPDPIMVNKKHQPSNRSACRVPMSGPTGMRGALNSNPV